MREPLKLAKPAHGIMKVRAHACKLKIVALSTAGMNKPIRRLF